MMIISREKIVEYIPQRVPFIMIDTLIEASPKLFKSGFTIEQGNIFLENGYLREFGLIENIAQTASAGLAFTQYKIGSEKPDGYLGGISKLKLYDLPKLGDSIDTTVNLIAQLESMFLIKGTNYLHGKILMECEMKLAGRSKQQ